MLNKLAANSEHAYFETGSHTGEAYKFIGNYIKTYIAGSNYESQENKDLSLMMCIDLYDNKGYEKAVISCDKWITK